MPKDEPPQGINHCITIEINHLYYVAHFTGPGKYCSERHCCWSITIYSLAIVLLYPPEGDSRQDSPTSGRLIWGFEVSQFQCDHGNGFTYASEVRETRNRLHYICHTTCCIHVGKPCMNWLRWLCGEILNTVVRKATTRVCLSWPI